jgi:hypothetical protein
MTEKRKGYALRISQDLYEDLRVWADDELRSVNGQIELILRTAVQAKKGSNSIAVAKKTKKAAS